MHVQVLQWMEDAGTRPSLQMYHDVLSYTWRDKSTEYAVQIQERISMEIHFLYMKLWTTIPCFKRKCCEKIVSWYHSTRDFSKWTRNTFSL